MGRYSIFRRDTSIGQPDERPVIPRPVIHAAPPERVVRTWYFSYAANYISVRTVHLNSGGTAPAPLMQSGADDASPADIFRRFRH